jgi:hypothetical protein
MLRSQTWLAHPLKLTGQTIDLLSLGNEHLDALYELAKDKRIWEYFPFDGSNRNRLDLHYAGTLSEREKGNHHPFIIFNKQTNKIIGSTSLYV